MFALISSHWLICLILDQLVFGHLLSQTAAYPGTNFIFPKRFSPNILYLVSGATVDLVIHVRKLAVILDTCLYSPATSNPPSALSPEHSNLCTSVHRPKNNRVSPGLHNITRGYPTNTLTPLKFLLLLEAKMTFSKCQLDQVTTNTRPYISKSKSFQCLSRLWELLPFNLTLKSLTTLPNFLCIPVTLITFCCKHLPGFLFPRCKVWFPVLKMPWPHFRSLTDHLRSTHQSPMQSSSLTQWLYLHQSDYMVNSVFYTRLYTPRGEEMYFLLFNNILSG